MPEPKITGRSILIVDDSVLIVQRIRGILKDVKNVGQIFSAGSYNDAVKILTEEKPGIVLLDIQLPGKNGLELLRVITKDHPGIKVVMISNHTSEYYQRLCRKTGAAGFIDKSKDFDLIPGILESI